MTHKIKVQMFGNFRMDYNGAPFVAEKMHKESQFNRMMQALIHYSDCGIAKDKLEEIVIGERDIDAPHTALRVIVYKTKQKLAQLGLPGKNLIYLEGGIYYWTPDIEIEEDAAEFEKLYNEACALEKQMPQEPESAETVCDERIKEIEDNMLELYVKALYLYKGEFLAAYTGETWIAQEARRYHIMFEKIINEAAYILRKRKQFKGLEKLGVYAAKVDPFNEWEELIMEAMVETRRYDEAEELYTDVVDYYLRECGIYPSSRLLEILEKYSNQMNHAHEILENIQEGMNEQEETERGGYFCSYPVFRGIYQASIRIMKRTRVPVYLMLCTLEDEEGRQVQSETKMNKYSRQLKKCVGESIRYWFKYSEAIDYFVVGTDEHKRSLEAFLKEYDCFVPHIAAIPPGAIPEGKLKSKNNRWRGSIISASRLSPRKGIDILIKSVIKAHEINQTINLDIYGKELNMSKNTNNNQTVDEKKGKRTGLTILGYVLVIVALLTVLPVVLPPIFGYHTYLSGTDHTGNISKYGSVVYLKTIDEATYKDGNIVAIESADSSARRVDSYYVDSNDSSAKEIALRDGNGVSYKVVKGQVIAKTPFIGYLSQLCFSAVGIIVTVVIFAAGVVIMMYVNKISKEINTMVEQQTA